MLSRQPIFFRRDVPVRYTHLALALGNRKIPATDSKATIRRSLDARNRRADLRREIQSLDTEVFFSIASLRELSIKSALDKISFPANPGAYVQRQLKRQNFKLLDIDLTHIDAVAVLPGKHRDPFDRMIIAQAKVEALTVVTADRTFVEYDIATVLV